MTDLGPISILFPQILYKKSCLKWLPDRLSSCLHEDPEAALSDEMIGFWVIVIVNDIAGSV